MSQIINIIRSFVLDTTKDSKGKVYITDIMKKMRTDPRC